MPAPSPSIPPSVGARPGTSVDGGGPHEGAEAEPDAGEGGAEGVARGAQVAQHGDQQGDGDSEADDLTDREPAGGGAVDRLAGHGDGHAGLLQPGGGGLEALAGGAVQIGTAIRRREPVTTYLRRQARFAHLFDPIRRDEVIDRIQRGADRTVARYQLDRPEEEPR